MNEDIIMLLGIVVFAVAGFVTVVYYKSDGRDGRDGVLPLVIMFCILICSLPFAISLNTQTLPEYQTGYNDFPDNTTYNEIIELENPSLEFSNYKCGWEQAKEDSIKLEIENDINKNISK